MNLIPHFTVRKSALPKFFGNLFIGRPFVAWTIGFWTFLPGRLYPTVRVKVHEFVHVKQFAVCWITAIVVSIAFRSLIGILLSPLCFVLTYGFASLVIVMSGGHWYRDNPFEVEARRIAGEP